MVPGSARNWSSCSVTNNRNQFSMKTSSRLNLPLWLIAACLATILPAAMLMLSAQTSMAQQHGSATWTGLGPGPQWYDPLNWTSGGSPNGPSDTATFAGAPGTPDVTGLTEVDGIIFTSGASAYTIF